MEDHSESAKTTTPPFYKEWFRSSSSAGFISLTPWLVDATGRPVGKVVVDIGSVSPSNNEVLSNTKCYVDAVDLAVYLRAVVNRTAENLYPQRSGTFSPESFIMFGGTAGENPVARVFKIEHWGANSGNAGNGDAFVWKCGHFEGKVSDTGAIQPIYDKAIRSDMIKRTRLAMHTISYKLDLLLNGYVGAVKDWYDH